MTGIESGYNNVGFRNSVPSRATIKLNFRLVSGQNPVRVAKLLKQFVWQNVPLYVEVSTHAGHAALSSKLDTSNQYVKRAEEKLSKAFGKRVVYKYSGGTLPIAAEVDKVLKIPQVYAPLANEDCNMHGANENFEISLLKKSLRFSRGFLGKI